MTHHAARPRDLVELVTLGLLCERARHPYDMLRTLKMRGNADHLRGLPRSLYHAVDRLVRGGFVVAGAASRDGSRPERTVYEITEDGRSEFRFRMQELLSRPSDPTAFHAALSMVGGIDRDDALWALRTRIAFLEGDVAQMTATHAAAVQQVPRLFLVELQYLQALLVAELAWVRRIATDIESGELEWNPSFPSELHPPDTT